MLVPFGRDGSGVESKGEGETDETLEGEVRVANKAEDNATVLPAKGRTLIFLGVAAMHRHGGPAASLRATGAFTILYPTSLWG